MPVENTCSFATLKFQSDQFICMSDLEREVLSAYLLAAAIKALGGPDLTTLDSLEAAIEDFKKQSVQRLDSMDLAVAVDIALVAGVNPDTLTQAALTPIMRSWLCADQNNWRAAKTLLMCLLTNTETQPVCWVAREVYGRFDPRWLVFRSWLHTDAPGWLLKLYRSKGQWFAGWIADKPRVKRLVRYLMDRVVNAD